MSVIDWLGSDEGMAWSRRRHAEIHWGTGIFASIKEDDSYVGPWEYGNHCYTPQWETGKICVADLGVSIGVDESITDLPSPA